MCADGGLSRRRSSSFASPASRARGQLRGVALGRHPVHHAGPIERQVHLRRPRLPRLLQPRPRLRALALPRAPGRRVAPLRRRPPEPLLGRPRHAVVHPLGEHQVQVRVVRHARLLREAGVQRQRVRQLTRRHMLGEAARQLEPPREVERVGQRRRQRPEQPAVAPLVAVGRRPVQPRVRRRERRHRARLEVHHLVLAGPGVLADAADVVVLRRRRLAGRPRAGLHVDVAVHGVVPFRPKACRRTTVSLSGRLLS